MFVAITFLAIAILAAIGLVREMRRKNFFAVGFAGITFLVFGAFSVATIVRFIISGGTQGVPL